MLPILKANWQIEIDLINKSIGILDMFDINISTV